MRHVSAATILLGLLVGCSPSPEKPATQSETPASPVEAPVMEPPEGQSEPVLTPDTPTDPTAESSKADDASGLKLDILDWAQTQAIVAEHPGKVVVFDLWATYCPPCLKEFPGLVALQEKYPDDVVCVSVCLDYGDEDTLPAKIEPDIRERLVRFKAHKVRNVLLNTTTEDLFKTLEHGSMPILYVFDQTGKKVAMFPDLDKPVDPTYERDIVPVVEKLLANPPQR